MESNPDLAAERILNEALASYRREVEALIHKMWSDRTYRLGNAAISEWKNLQVTCPSPYRTTLQTIRDRANRADAALMCILWLTAPAGKPYPQLTQLSPMIVEGLVELLRIIGELRPYRYEDELYNFIHGIDMSLLRPLEALLQSMEELWRS